MRIKTLLLAIMLSSAALAGDIDPGLTCADTHNQFGHPHTCECPKGFNYQAELGRCLQSGAHYQKSENCTRSMNRYGMPRRCECDDGYAYNGELGLCIKPAARND